MRAEFIIRMKVADLRVVGRATQGVKLINLNEDDVIAAVTQVPSEDEKETEDINQEQDNTVENNNNDN